MTRRIYLDNHATTPCDPRVVEAMLPYFSERFGNAASRTHLFGWEAEEAVEVAREVVAHVINAQPKEIIFTSGATESNNLAIKGVASARNFKGHIITTVIEHPSILSCCKSLQKQGVPITYLRVDKHGSVDLQQLADAITADTILISIMAANNEIGTIADLEKIGNIAKENNVLLHTDAAQAFGKIPIDVEKMNISLLSFTGHKIYGPKGIGGLYVRSKGAKTLLQPIIEGGGHERNLRSGTLNVPGIVGTGKASEIYLKEREKEAEHLARLRQRLYDGIKHEIDDIILNGHPQQRLPGNLNLSFPSVDGQALLMALGNEIALSSGSACTTSIPRPSHVLKAIGLSDELIHSSLRFGIGRFNTVEEIDYTIDRVVNEVRRLRKVSSNFSLKNREPRVASSAN